MREKRRVRDTPGGKVPPRHMAAELPEQGPSWKHRQLICAQPCCPTPELERT